MTAIFLLDSMLLSIHRLQNVCRHGMVFGSAKRSPQMEQVISSLICCHSFSTSPPPLAIVWLHVMHAKVFGSGCFVSFTGKSGFRKRENLSCVYVTQSGKTGLIAYLKVSRNAGLKYLVCCSSPTVEAMCTKFSHALHQFLTFQSIHCENSQQLSFPLF